MTKTRWIIAAVVVTLAVSASVAPGGDRRMCKTCGESIRGAYFETGGFIYHPDCFTCGHCKEPIKGPFTSFRGENYHPSCFETDVALRCAVCDGVIEGQYLLDHWGNAYHTRHKGKVLQCDFCQRFIVGGLGNGMKRLHDHRVLCAKCAPSSVIRMRDARSIVVDVAADLARFGIDVDPKPILLRMVGQDELARIADNDSHETKGFTDYLVNRSPFGGVKAESLRVYLLYGMPRTQAVGTVAHELMHVWQFQKGSIEQDPTLSEGSCNFASYLVLRRRATPEAEFVIDSMSNDPDPVYGEGYRRVKAYVEREGLAAWLRLLETKHSNFAGR